MRSARDPGGCGAGTGRLQPRSGAVLLEAIVALVVLATAGVAAVTLTVESSTAAERARVAEARIHRASALLEAVSLWPREDLDRHLGDRPQGPYRLRVTHPYPTLYVAQVRDSTGTDVLVGTALYRPGAASHGSQ